MCRLYVTGLIEREAGKNVQRMAARLGQPSHDAMHHFITSGRWDTGALEAALSAEADRCAGGPSSLLVVREVALLKKGSGSVGVAPQPVAAAGKVLNCQVLVALTLVQGVVAVPVGLRLFLPESWTGDGERMRRAGVPEDLRRRRGKAEIALAELDRVASAGARFGCVLLDAGYGMSAAVRRAMRARGLHWVVTVPGGLMAVPAGPRSPPDVAESGAEAADGVPRSVETMLAGVGWDGLARPRGAEMWPSTGSTASFAALRARVAEGQEAGAGEAPAHDLPRGPIWIIGERREGEQARYYASNLPARSSLRTLAGAIRGRWAAGRALRIMGEELGLDDFEGRSWIGLHRHALMSMLAYAFLQGERLRGARDGINGVAERPRPAAGPSA